MCTAMNIIGMFAKAVPADTQPSSALMALIDPAYRALLPGTNALINSAVANIFLFLN